MKSPRPTKAELEIWYELVRTQLMLKRLVQFSQEELRAIHYEAFERIKKIFPNENINLK